MGADGVVLSNHGGRQLDTTHTGIDTLLEIRKHAPYLLRPEFRGPTGVQPAALEHPENLTPPDPQGSPPTDHSRFGWMAVFGEALTLSRPFVWVLTPSDLEEVSCMLTLLVVNKVSNMLLTVRMVH